MEDKVSVSLHMESHYRRIATAKGRIDTGMPTAMKLGVKNRDRHRKKKRMSIASTNREQDTPHELDPVLDFKPPTGSVMTSTPRSDLYFTQTGRKLSPCKPNSQSSSPPWIPVLNTRYSSTRGGQSSCSNKLNTVTERMFEKQSKLSNTRPATSCNDDVIKIEEISQVEQFNETDSPSVTTSDRDNIFTTQRMLWESLAESNAIIRQRIEQSRQEQIYLQFCSSITNDILSRGVYNNQSELETLFETHITRNKQRLRENLMRKKIEWLKRQIDIYSSN